MVASTIDTREFQSLFSWNLPSDVGLHVCSSWRDRFQSLFSWNLPSDALTGSPKEPNKNRFNPCFLGTCPRTQTLSPGWSAGGCFNPCFLGTCPRTRTDRILEPAVPWFQSLFSWNLPSDLIHFLLSGESDEGFNPCFLGTCPRTEIIYDEGLYYEAFQSLFSWNLPSDGVRTTVQCRGARFQSLFSWNLPSD